MFNKKAKKTEIIICYDAGFQNNLYVRGNGIPGLSWEKGQKLKNIKSNEWLLEVSDSFQEGEFKVLLNDKNYEVGDNHHVRAGSTVKITPRF